MKDTRKIYIFKWLFHMCKLKNFPVPKNNKIQTLEPTNHTYHTTNGRKVQSIFPPYSSSVNLKVGD